jgi:release factor glutamine methyltransferase
MYSSLNAIKQHFRTELSKNYTERESDLLFYRLLESFFGFRKTDIVLTPNLEIDADQKAEIDLALKQLVAGVPVQYIDNTAFFMDDAFFVDDSVLIPRPETEELIRWILDTHDSTALKVLDIGTGSGVIPISLSKQRSNWTLLACDISNEALITARRNGREILKQTDVAFYKEDILEPQTNYGNGLDIIVSNPPYVLESDKMTMGDNVLKHEPHIALFVPNEDPLLFYKAIVKFALTSLKIGGCLYFEIHESYSIQVHDCMIEGGFKDVVIKNDLQGKPRMISGVLG